MAMDDDPEHEHIVMHVLVKQEPIQPRWLAVVYMVLAIALVILGVGTAIALIAGWPWVVALTRVTQVLTLVMLAGATVLMLRLTHKIRRDREEISKVETRLYKQWMDLKVENDRAGRPPLPPPPGL